VKEDRMRHHNTWSFLYGFIYVFAVALIIALAEYARRRKSRNPGRQKRKCKAFIQDQTQPQDALTGNVPARRAVKCIGDPRRTVQGVKRVVSLNPTRVTQRIFKPRILFQNVPNPPHIVAARKIDPIEIVLIEQRAQVRQTTWDLGVNEKKLRRFDLAFPQTDIKMLFYNNVLSSLFVYYGNSPVNGSDEDRLYLPNLTNVGSTGEVCMGHNVDQLRSEICVLSREEQVKRILDYFWYGSAFHLHHMAEANFKPWAEIEPRLSSLEEWERQTLLNPLFILTIDWARRGKFVTVRDALNPFHREGG
jgi:hypothetical protein